MDVGECIDSRQHKGRADSEVTLIPLTILPFCCFHSQHVDDLGAEGFSSKVTSSSPLSCTWNLIILFVGFLHLCVVPCRKLNKYPQFCIALRDKNVKSCSWIVEKQRHNCTFRLSCMEHFNVPGLFLFVMSAFWDCFETCISTSSSGVPDVNTNWRHRKISRCYVGEQLMLLFKLLKKFWNVRWWAQWFYLDLEE